LCLSYAETDNSGVAEPSYRVEQYKITAFNHNQNNLFCSPYIRQPIACVALSVHWYYITTCFKSHKWSVT
jgi:hypothetical protein